MITDVAWVTGRVPGEGGPLFLWRAPGLCQYLVTAGRGAQVPAPPQSLSSHQCLYWLLQGSLGCRKRLECSLAPRLHLARAGMWV